MNISIKLDGVSVLYCYNNGNINLYTKGTGINGRDITNFAKYLNIPLINKKNDKLP
jgi:NAD-dependent DNA ligase